MFTTSKKFFIALFLVALALALIGPSRTSAQAILTIKPITWNIIGLDSNNVNIGPNKFPVGIRVCNTGTTSATNVTATFVWDDGLNKYTGDPYINLRAGSLDTITISSLAAGSCTDFYFEVEVTRNAGAYNHTRRYHINVTADGGINLSSPQPRELFMNTLFLKIATR